MKSCLGAALRYSAFGKNRLVHPCFVLLTRSTPINPPLTSILEGGLNHE
jgi:hypothetical protein